MKSTPKLEEIIQLSTDISYLSQLRERILNSTELSENDKTLFEKICSVASEFENWNNSDLKNGVSITQNRLKAEFSLADESISILVRLISYEWK